MPGAAPVISMFMLGDGNVGKTAVIQQMQKLCVLTAQGSNGPDDAAFAMYDQLWREEITPFGEDERRALTTAVRQHVLKLAAILIEQSARFGYTYSSPLHTEWARRLHEASGHSNTVHQRQVVFTGESAQQMASLWNEPHGAWAKTAARANEFSLPTTADYFLQDDTLMRIAAVEYSPSIDDIIHARTPTQGSPKTYNFEINGRRFSIHDVGGQQAELKRVGASYLPGWLKCVRRNNPRGTYYILFVAALSDYNQPNADKDSTLLQDSFCMLQNLLQSWELNDVRYIVFLNKTDVFNERVTRLRDIDRYFGAAEKQSSSAARADTVADDSRERIMSHLAEIFKHCPISPYVKCTCATDTQVMKTLLAASIDYTLEHAWQLTGGPVV